MGVTPPAAWAANHYADGLADDIADSVRPCLASQSYLQGQGHKAKLVLNRILAISRALVETEAPDDLVIEPPRAEHSRAEVAAIRKETPALPPWDISYSKSGTSSAVTFADPTGRRGCSRSSLPSAGRAGRSRQKVPTFRTPLASRTASGSARSAEAGPSAGVRRVAT